MDSATFFSKFEYAWTIYQRAAIFISTQSERADVQEQADHPTHQPVGSEKIAAIPAMMNTIMVEIIVSRRVGQVTFAVSERTCCRNVKGLVFDAIDCSRHFGA